MTRSALQNRNYLVYLTGNTISLHGLWVYRVALGWFAWQLSGSELWVGIVAFTQFAPAVVFGPIFGVLADRFDRRATSVLINSGSVINMLVLGLLTFLGHIDIHTLVLLSLVQGMLDGAHAPVRMSIVPNLVARPQLENAIAITSISFNLSRFVGPALAGVVIATWGVAAAFVINGISYLSLIAAMVVVRLNPSGAGEGARKHPWNELVDGARYVVTHRTIRSLLVLTALGSVFGRGALEMLPAFADVVYRGGAGALATMTSAIGGGAVIGGLVLTRGTSWLTPGVVRVLIVIAGCLVSLLGITEQLPIAVGIVATLGVTLSFCGVGSQILIQTLVDDEVRGRVSSFWGMIAFGGTSLGALVIGAVARLWDLQLAVGGTGLVCAALAIVSARSSRAAR
ncbi:MAG TPA: MFS transporter [Woeseiaceae bacterium]|jgi:MFS family permease|nr:MFS transporter [Woeseiaceae bacterium]